MAEGDGSAPRNRAAPDQRAAPTRDEELSLARTIIDNAAEGIFHLDDHGRTTFVNSAGEAMFGWTAAELAGRPLHDVVHYRHPDGSAFPMAECALGNVFVTGETLKGHEDVFFHRDGRPVPVSCSNAAIVRDGRVVGSVLIVRDVTERHAAEAHRQLLLEELNHRVKNTLSIVQSLARQTFRGGDGERAHLKTFEARLSALSAAHNVLTHETWKSASIASIAEETLAPFGLDAGRVRLEGEPVHLTPKAAVSLALALHELATNAAKYGALSGEAGRVTLAWDLSGEKPSQRLRLAWTEADGPPVTAPTRRGFGSRMIEDALTAEFGAPATLEFRPEGVRFVLEAPYAPPADAG